jgi:hypothetical protein
VNWGVFGASRSVLFTYILLVLLLDRFLKMAGPDAGALGGTFRIVRILQVVSLIAIIGMAANFVAEMVSSNNAPSNVLVGTLSIVSIVDFCHDLGHC